MTRNFEGLCNHTDAGDTTGGVDSNHDGTGGSRGAVEKYRADWQN